MEAWTIKGNRGVPITAEQQNGHDNDTNSSIAFDKHVTFPDMSSEKY